MIMILIIICKICLWLDIYIHVAFKSTILSHLSGTNDNKLCGYDPVICIAYLKILRGKY